MTDRVQLLNERGTKVFRQYLAKRGTLVREPPPFAILDDPACCEDLGAPIEIERTPGGRKFANRYAFGQYLQQKLSDLDRTRIFRTFGLWNWLSLYYFDQLCPPALDGSRELLATETYLLSPQQQYRLSFRHLVRAPWYAVCEHGENARVLLIHADRGISPLATRGAVFEQLASRQNILNNPTLIAAAQRLYFDEIGQPRPLGHERPRTGLGPTLRAGGPAAGADLRHAGLQRRPADLAVAERVQRMEGQGRRGAAARPGVTSGATGRLPLLADSRSDSLSK
ncbi:MAG: hypothetical protein M5U07_07550 [Xanthobacteraceae bacterium]|nr:hypothetical protein [Xanthobacteraceae bacterium]